MTEKQTYAEGTSSKNLKRGHCAVCYTNVTLKCEQCGTYLYPDVTSNKSVNCFKYYRDNF